jgi:phospholipase/carboxylesterase
MRTCVLLRKSAQQRPLKGRIAFSYLGAAFLAVALASAPAAADDELKRDDRSGLQYLEIETGGADAADPLPVIIALHGLGDRPEAFRLLLDDLPAKARLILPRAPTPHGADGFSWFAFHADDEQGMAELGAGIRSAASQIAALIESIALKRGGPKRAVVCGFSQGGMLSFALAASHPELVSEAIPVSGSLPVALWPKEPPKLRPLPKIVALHGEADKLIPVTTAKWTVEALKSQGYDTRLKSYPGVAHALSNEMRAALLAEVASAVEALDLPGAAARSGAGVVNAVPAP